MSRRHLLLTGCILILLWTLIQWRHLQLDPWNDELYTLQHFVLAPLRNTITDYHVPNNHILLSLLLNLWRRLWNLQDLEAILERIWLVRLLPLLFSAATVCIVFRTAFRMGGVQAGVPSAVFLMTSVPFYNYGAQLRGYGLSMMLYAWLIDELTRERPRGWILSLLSAALLYAIPSNLYLLVATTAAVCIAAPGDGASKRAIAVAMGCGVAIAGVAYMPVLGQMQDFAGTRPHGATWTPIRTTAPLVAWHLLSGRWILLILPAVYLSVRLRHRTRGLPERLLLISGICFAVPFLLSAIRGDGAPDRIFITVLPLLCLSWGVITGRAVSGISGILKPGAFYLNVVLCAFLLLRGEWAGEAKAHQDRQRGLRCADLYYQYYLHGFHPRRTARAFAMRHRPASAVLDECRMDTELLKYLRFEGIPVQAADGKGMAHYLAVVDGPVLKSGAAIAFTDSSARERIPGVVVIRSVRGDTAVLPQTEMKR